MPNDELFSGIPSLDDEAGMQSFLNNDTLTTYGLGTDTTPAALQQTTPAVEPAQAAPATATPAQTQSDNVPQFTAAQVAEIVARARQTQPAAQPTAQSTYPNASQSAYSPRQAEIIKQLIDKGVSLDRIQSALNGQSNANSQNSALMQRLASVEAYLQNQQYVAAQNEFVDKMTTFGNKFGLSENDLVTFGNKAMSMGINLTQVSDVEAVFRAVYPDQYAIRSQRMAGAPSSQIYGGSSTPESPRAMTSKMEDAYVDQFLKNSMPNQYGMYTKK